MKLKKLFLMIIAFLSSALSKESFREFLNDNRGGLVLSFGDIDFKDTDWIEYKLLKVDKSVKPINPEDLPEDFCEEACRLVDEFHRKTVNQKVEWMLYFDYKTGEVVYCWKGEEGRAIGDFEKIIVKGRNICSIHSHVFGYYSFPSPDNFDILENDFEDYEIITSINAFWIVEFKGSIDEISRTIFQQDIRENMKSVMSVIGAMHNAHDIHIREEVIGNYLINGIDKEIQGINLVLTKKEYD